MSEQQDLVWGVVGGRGHSQINLVKSVAPTKHAVVKMDKLVARILLETELIDGGHTDTTRATNEESWYHLDHRLCIFPEVCHFLKDRGFLLIIRFHYSQCHLQLPFSHDQ